VLVRLSGWEASSCRQNNHREINTRHVIFISWFGQVTLAYFHVVASQWTRVALNPFQVIRWSTWIPRFFLYMIIPVCEESPQDWSLSPLQQRSQWNHGVRLGWATHTRHKSQNTHAHKRRLELKRQHRESSTRIELKSLTQWTECAGTESGCFRMLSECLCNTSMRLGGPFIAPRQPGAIAGQSRKAKVAFCRVVHRTVRCTTGQSL
jgi:hypothetical protein